MQYPSPTPPYTSYPPPAAPTTYPPAPALPTPPPPTPPSSTSLPPPPSNPSIPYIGALISLISKANLRYEGRLYTIDPKASTVALQAVRCYGSEDRGLTREDFVPASSVVYEFIVFSGKDIKDLHVLQRQEGEGQTQPRVADPAILSSSTKPTQPSPPPSQPMDQPSAATATAAPAADDGAAAVESLSIDERPAPAPSSRPGGPRAWQARGGQSQAASAPSNGPRYTVSILSSRPLPPTNHPHGPTPADLTSPFDIEASNARFNKSSFINQLNKASPASPPTLPPPAASSSSSAADALLPPPTTVEAPADILLKADEEGAGIAEGEGVAQGGDKAPVIAVKYDKKKRSAPRSFHPTACTPPPHPAPSSPILCAVLCWSMFEASSTTWEEEAVGEEVGEEGEVAWEEVGVGVGGGVGGRWIGRRSARTR